MSSMTFVIHGRPATKKNSLRVMRNRRTGSTFVAQSAAGCDWERAAVLQVQAQLRGRERIVTGQWNLRARVYRDRDVGDLGNYLAAVCDALERGGVVINDCLIRGFDGSRLLLDRSAPRVEVELTEMP